METSLLSSTSYLPGKLKEAAHAVLRPDEQVHCEFSPALGTGLLLTDIRLIVVQGGLLRTHKVSGMQSAFVAISQIRAMSYELKGDEADGAYLVLSTAGANLPPWATRIAIDQKSLPQAFRLSQLLYAMLGQLSLESPISESLPRPRAVCPVCDAPLLQAIERKP